MMRSFGNLPGKPTIIVTCHPTKNPDMDNLLPRGGGAFLNEMDGNLVAINRNTVVTVTWQGKFRGPEFAPILFKLNAGTTEKLKDSKGRLVWTITAAPLNEEDKTVLDAAARERQDKVLLLLNKKGGLSLAAIATELQWFSQNGQPYKTLVDRVVKELIRAGLVESGCEGCEGGGRTRASGS
jgi:hypothetical protein